MKSETYDKKQVEKMLSRRYNVLFQRIETGAEDGIPDVYLRTILYDNWLEFKHLINLPRNEMLPVKPKLRPNQWSWINNARALGARVWLITMTSENIIIMHYGDNILKEYMNLYHFKDLASYCNKNMWDGEPLHNLFNVSAKTIQILTQRRLQ